jgi:hypothetical protein
MSYGSLERFSALQIYRGSSLHLQAAVNREGQRRQRSGIGGILKARCSKNDVEAPIRADISSFHASFIAATRGYGVEGPHSTLSRRSQARRQSRLKSHCEVFKDLARPPFKPLIQTHKIHELSGVSPGKQLPADSEGHSVYPYFENEPFNRTLLELHRFLTHGWYCTLH